MTEKQPYAYQRWACSECEGEPIEERTDQYDLRCETCGHTFATRGGGYATYVPDPDDEFAGSSVQGEQT